MSAIYLTGKLVGNPIFESTKKGQPMARFLIETERIFLWSGEPKSETLVVPLVAFGWPVDSIKILSPGDLIHVAAHLNSFKYKNDGEEKYSLSLVVDSIFIPAPKSSKEAR